MIGFGLIRYLINYVVSGVIMLSKEDKKEQERILREGSAYDCFLFAYYIKGADKIALQDRVLAIGSAFDCLCFIKYVEGADKKRLHDRIKDLNTTCTT